jgi:hypothetical protein
MGATLGASYDRRVRNGRAVSPVSAGKLSAEATRCARVYAGIDPLTGKRLYLTESTADEKEAERILNRLLAQVDEASHARTKGTLRAALADWLRLLEIEDSTRETYEMYVRRYIDPGVR